MLLQVCMNKFAVEEAADEPLTEAQEIAELDKLMEEKFDESLERRDDYEENKAESDPQPEEQTPAEEPVAA